MNKVIKSLRATTDLVNMELISDSGSAFDNAHVRLLLDNGIKPILTCPIKLMNIMLLLML